MLVLADFVVWLSVMFIIFIWDARWSWCILVVSAVLVNELKVTRVVSDVSAFIFDKHLLGILAKYFDWSMPFSAVHALIADRVSCDMFDVTRCSYILRQSTSNFLRVFTGNEGCLALCMASRLLLTILLTGWCVRAGTFSFSVDCSFRFLPKLSW